MSRACINPFTHLDYGRFGGGAQCFMGLCAPQGRADVTATAAWPGSAHLTVAADTGYVAVHLTAPGLIYAGPSGSTAVYDAQAATYPAGWWPMGVNVGDVVLVRDLGA